MHGPVRAVKLAAFRGRFHGVLTRSGVRWCILTLDLGQAASITETRGKMAHRTKFWQAVLALVFLLLVAATQVLADAPDDELLGKNRRRGEPNIVVLSFRQYK